MGAADPAPDLNEAYMKRFNTICSTLLLVPALALASAQARAEFKCDTPQSRIDRVACEKAVEGPIELRQYIARMRGIHSMHFPDYVNEAQALAWAQSGASRSATKKVSVQTAQQLTEEPGA